MVDKRRAERGEGLVSSHDPLMGWGHHTGHAIHHTWGLASWCGFLWGWGGVKDES
jgi:hypothetical protein